MVVLGKLLFSYTFDWKVSLTLSAKRLIGRLSCKTFFY